KIAKIIWGLNLELAAINVQQPDKRSHGKDGETDCDPPEPDGAIPHQSRWKRILHVFVSRRFSRPFFYCRNGSGLLYKPAISSSKQSCDCACGATQQRQSCANRIQPSSHEPQDNCADHRQIDERNPSCDPLHGTLAGEGESSGEGEGAGDREAAGEGEGAGFGALPSKSGALPGNMSLNTLALKKILDGSW